MTLIQKSLLIALGGILVVGCGDSSNGASSGSSSSSGGSTGGESTGSTGSTASDPTVIASGLNDPADLAVSGSTLLLSDNAPQGSDQSVPNAGSIERVPVAGGTPSEVVGSLYAPGAIAVDGSNLYWLDMDASFDVQIKKANLDGSSPSVLATLGDSASVDQDTRLFAVNDTLYWGDDSLGVMSLPTSGGSPTQLIAPSALFGGPLVAAGSTGLVWTEGDGSNTLLRHAALDGTGAATLTTFATGLDGVIYPAAVGVDGTNLVWFQVERSGGDDVSSLYEVALTGGTPTKVLDYDGEVDAMAVDANGIYFHDDVAETEAVYKVTGSTSAIFHSAPNKLTTSANNQRSLRLDAANLYWVSGGFNGGQAALHKKAR